MSHIVVYQDAGVSPGALQQLLNALKEPFLSHYTVHLVNRHFFLTENWEESTALVIFPGGRDLPYHQALQGKANERIASYVEKGGRFFGICAGGYYGSAAIEFEKGKELEIICNRELAFFPGRAVGPAFSNSPFEYGSETGAQAVSIVWEKGVSTLYFNGGCYFEDPSQHPGVQILARYSSLPGEPAAVVLCSRGQGAALLSGIHPEYAPKDPFWNYIINKILI